MEDAQWKPRRQEKRTTKQSTWRGQREPEMSGRTAEASGNPSDAQRPTTATQRHTGPPSERMSRREKRLEGDEQPRQLNPTGRHEASMNPANGTTAIRATSRARRLIGRLAGRSEGRRSEPQSGAANRSESSRGKGNNRLGKGCPYGTRSRIHGKEPNERAVSSGCGGKCMSRLADDQAHVTVAT